MRSTLLAALIALAPVSAMAATCGGNFNSFKDGLISEARKHRVSAETAERFLAGVRQDAAVLRSDQLPRGVPTPFVDFSRRLISNDRISRGVSNGKKYSRVFDRVESATA